MRITARQLRQIIKEELTRSLRMNEADLFTQADLDADFDARMDRKMDQMNKPQPLAGYDPDEVERSSSAVKMPSRPPEPGGALAAGAAGFPARKLIASEMPEFFMEFVKMLTNPTIKKELQKIYVGDKVLSIGSTGPDVKVYQAIVMSNLLMWAKARSSLLADADLSLDPIEVGEMAIIKDGKIPDTDLAGAIFALTTMPMSTLVDGSYGPLTRAAVALVQVCMDRRQIIMSSDGGSPVNWDAEVDGKIGRQTAQYLAGFTKLGAISGVTLKESRHRRRF